MKLISIVTPCFNEENNILELRKRVQLVTKGNNKYDFEHIFIDNSSTDRTLDILKKIALEDKTVKIIVNVRNFGHIRSPYHAYLQARGDAVISLVCDLQDPPELINEFITKWESGFKVVVGIKTASKENIIMYRIRSFYYKIIRFLANIDLLEQYAGFGLYDKSVIDIFRNIKEPYPYFRGLIAEFANNIHKVEYTQPRRFTGKSNLNFIHLFDNALLGITSYSKIPLRLATMVGLITACFSLLLVGLFIAAKIIFWNKFIGGIAPIVIGMFFLGSINLFFLGFIAEYVGAILTYVQNRPLVVEKERINF